MQSSPVIGEIKQWLIKKNLLGLFADGKLSIQDIDPKPWSGHFNYLVAAGKKKFVLRFKGPEWGEPTTGIINEFKILKAVQHYKVGPAVYYLGEDFFGESVMLEEYLEGKPLSDLSQKEQEKLFLNYKKNQT